MALQSLSGGFVLIGPSPFLIGANGVGVTTNTLNGVNHAIIYTGRIKTSDGASHVIDTSGSSKMEWRTDSITFASGSTSVSVGLAPVDTSNGPPVRASNTTGVINFDVKGVFAGGGGGITSAAMQTSVPTTGTKTIADGDLVCFAIQMTARGGADSVTTNFGTLQSNLNRPNVTFYNGSFAARNGIPNVFITFADGATGWFEGGEIFSTADNVRTWNSGSATKEYGQLYQLPFPCNVHGIWGVGGFSADCDLVLYSTPLGTPSAEKTVSVDANTVFGTGGNFFREMFASPYSATAGQALGAVFKPGASNVSAYYKLLSAAGQRIADPWGTNGYGISRASGAFADANSSLHHYYVGLIVSAFDDATGGGTTTITGVIGS